ncbi:MAG TPA: hypothetical protein DCS24_07920 [Erythrobacter sp.]|nr:hypothetical protein [Erythrobacter sp.]
MMEFDMGAAWQRATTLISANFQLLAVIAGVFLFLPSLVIYLVFPDFALLMDPTADPEILAAQIQEVLSPLIGWGLAIMAFQFVGYLAMVGLIGKRRPTVGQAIAQGVRSTPTLFGTLILFALGCFIITFVLILFISLLALIVGPGALTFLTMVLILGVMLILMTRLCLTMPVVMLEDQLNPFTALLRSWQLTSANKWQIFSFWMLLGVVYLVITFLALGVFGLVGAAVESTVLAALILGIVNGVIGALVAVIISGVVVAMYQQLAGDSAGSVSATVE